MEKIIIIKKDGTREAFNASKIITAVGKSAARIMVKFTPDEEERIIKHVTDNISELGLKEVPILTMHSLVEAALREVNEKVAKSYCDYRNYKTSFIHIMDEVYTKSQAIRYIGDKSNANTDSALVATKRSLIFNELNKELYRKFFMTRDELQACKDGFIYIHDQSARLDTFNCCLCDIKSIMTGGFEMGNVWYNEPKTLDTAFDVLGDVILSTAAQQYGGFTVSEVDTLMEPYAEKSLRKYRAEYLDIVKEVENGYVYDTEPPVQTDDINSLAEQYALRKVKRDFEQGFQGIEYKLNTVGSSRGDYPFITFTFGLGTTQLAKMCSITMMEVHKEGQGKKGFKKPVLFPKYVFLYDENIHGVGAPCEDVFEVAIQCSAKTMYPDYLSLTGEGYVAGIYKKYGRAISPMGCRAFLSPWYERGGMEPADENDKPVYIGRCNLGAVSLHLPMILAESRRQSKDFYQVLDYYLEMIRGIHKRTYDYIGELRASVNPIMFCEGGMLGGHLKPEEKIRKLLPPMTLSFGITALNELQELYNGKSLVEDNQFALEVMQYINAKIAEYKKEDGLLYAIYGTPAESLCGLQVEQFRKKYGIIPGVSDRSYVSNSFHCHVTEKITPIEKQDREAAFWDLFNGGKIQYVRYPLNYNVESIRVLVRRAMKMGFYEGVNLSLSYCDNCGHEELEMDVCPVCGSHNLTKIDRMNGYLSYSRRGYTGPDDDSDTRRDYNSSCRLNAAKMEEIKDRISM